VPKDALQTFTTRRGRIPWNSRDRRRTAVKNQSKGGFKLVAEPVPGLRNDPHARQQPGQ